MRGMQTMLAAGFLAFATSGCHRAGGYAPFLEHAQSAQLYRLGRLDLSGADAGPNAPPKLAQWVIAGTAPAKDAPAVASEIGREIDAAGNMVASCFNPHHAARITDGTRTLTFLVCFECMQTEVFENDKWIQTVGIGGTSDRLEALFKGSGL